MGVKLLSKLLKTQCYDETKQIHLSSLYGKKICIDVSIYLYRYKILKFQNLKFELTKCER